MTNNFRVTATISWELNSQSYREALESARNQLDVMLDEYPEFKASLNITKLKKNKVKRIAEFGIEEVLPYITKHEEKKIYQVDGKDYEVKMNSDRYFVFLQNLTCVSCGLMGEVMILELNSEEVPHFNMYAKENNKLVLMTKDHILAKSKGGEDNLDNYKTMCHICNNLKGNFDLTYEQVYELRKIYNNTNKLSKKELRELIKITRKKMVNDEKFLSMARR